MSEPRIVAHTIVKNEQRWIWYALVSVIDYVDEILVWDTGSTDATVSIVKSIRNPKIRFRQLGAVDALGHSTLRQQMLDETRSDWMLVLDGDEVWWQKSIASVTETIKNKPNLSAIISPFYNAVGDIFHYQNPKSISYQIKEQHGPFTLRAINHKLPDLKIVNPHGRQEYQTNGVAIQNLKASELLYVNAPFLHLTHLPRSISRRQEQTTLKRSFKYRYDLGIVFDDTSAFPEVFYFPAPLLVPNPFSRRSFSYLGISLFITLLRIVKRLFRSPNNTGY